MKAEVEKSFRVDYNLSGATLFPKLAWIAFEEGGCGEDVHAYGATPDDAIENLKMKLEERMTTQPEALRLAEFLDLYKPNDGYEWKRITECSAAELRRLHEVNVGLVEALQLADAMLSGANMNANVVEKKVRAAIIKAIGETK